MSTTNPLHDKKPIHFLSKNPSQFIHFANTMQLFNSLGNGLHEYIKQFGKIMHLENKAILFETSFPNGYPKKYRTTPKTLFF